LDFLTVLMLVIGFIVAFAIGSNDETMSPAVGARVFTVKVAVSIGMVINLIGAVSLGGGVSEKVGSELVRENILSTEMIFGILISMAIWLLVASASKGLPISTTQCIVGSVIGVAIAAPLYGIAGWGVDAVDWAVLAEIFVGWIISPLIGFLFAGIIFAGVRRLQNRASGFYGRERQERIAAYGLAIFLIWTGLSRGGNDVANAVAPLVTLPDFQTPIQIGTLVIPGFYLPLIVGGLGMGFGLIVIGRKVIQTLATEVVELTPTSALSASISVAVIMFGGTYLGLPLSGTHVLVAALIAVGYVSQTPVRMKQVRNILISWVVTVPISAMLGVLVYGTILLIA
jgi:inorganic phosphate transporter, PiT family